MANDYSDDLKAALRGGFNPKTGGVPVNNAGLRAIKNPDVQTAISVQRSFNVMGDALRKGVPTEHKDIPTYARNLYKATQAAHGEKAARETALRAKEEPETISTNTPGLVDFHKGNKIKVESTFFSDLKDTLQELDTADAAFKILGAKANIGKGKTGIAWAFKNVHKKFEDYPEGQAEKAELEKAEPAKGLIAQERAQLLSMGTLNKAKNRAESVEVQKDCLRTINEFALGYKRVDTSQHNFVEALKPLVESQDMNESRLIPFEDVEEEFVSANEDFTTGDIASTFTTPFLDKPDASLDHTTELGPVTSWRHKKKRRIKQTAIAMGV